jgi:hypothetical protein
VNKFPLLGYGKWGAEFLLGEIAWAAEHKLRPADRNEVLAILEKLAPLSEPA